jgi:5-methylcytosine-specific restriction endonuclease McrA
MLGDATSTDVQQIMDASDSVCSYCLKVVDSLEIEHCIPLSRGGFHDVSNIVPACAPCNRRKGPRTVLEFLL